MSNKGLGRAVESWTPRKGKFGQCKEKNNKGGLIESVLHIYCTGIVEWHTMPYGPCTLGCGRNVECPL